METKCCEVREARVRTESRMERTVRLGRAMCFWEVVTKTVNLEENRKLGCRGGGL